MTATIQHWFLVATAASILIGCQGAALAQETGLVFSDSPQWVYRQGADETNEFIRLKSAGGILEGSLESPAASQAGLPNFYLEFNFRPSNQGHLNFTLNLSAATNANAALNASVLNLTGDSEKGWKLAATADAVSAWHNLSGGGLVSDTWYHAVLTGRNWSGTNSYSTFQIFKTGPADATTGSALVQITNSEPQYAGAHYFTLSNSGNQNSPLDLAEVHVGAIQPYQGLVRKGVDAQTLSAKVMCGYQGWFGAPGDGSQGHGWRHWTKHFGPLEDGNAKVDLWPDVSELSPDERFTTGFVLPDGHPAEVFSSYKEPTVLRHFQWMKEYGIDGVFVQRFAVSLRSSPEQDRCNTVLANCRAGANQNGRAYAVMYDLSGLRAGEIDRVIDDWRELRRKMVITDDPAYLHHHGKPVVAVWGIGFNDHRDYTLAECRRLVEFLKYDPEAGGCTVMVGVPAQWRKLDVDAVSDPKLLELLGMADVISPWTVGRYATPEGAVRYASETLKPDLAWCQERNIEYLPVVFPGFSWHNMYGAPSNKIPRLKGKFLWSQFQQAKRANVSMIYVAMFDEVDEGTAIFKCSDIVPVPGKSRFINFEGLPNDFYLKLVGSGAKLLRGEIPPDALLESPADKGRLVSNH